MGSGVVVVVVVGGGVVVVVTMGGVIGSITGGSTGGWPPGTSDSGTSTVLVAVPRVAVIRTVPPRNGSPNAHADIR